MTATYVERWTILVHPSRDEVDLRNGRPPRFGSESHGVWRLSSDGLALARAAAVRVTSERERYRNEHRSPDDPVTLTPEIVEHVEDEARLVARETERARRVAREATRRESGGDPLLRPARNGRVIRDPRGL